MLLNLMTVESHASVKINYWEAGGGMTYFQALHYLGADQSKSYALPFPHIVIESDVFSVNRSAINGHLSKSDFFKLDLSFGGQLKVDSEDNRAREGMPDLDYVLEMGPSPEFLISGHFKGNSKLTFDIPIRASMATDFKSAESIGWRVVPTLHWFGKWPGVQGWEFDSQLRYLYGSKQYHDYFYTIEDQYVTTNRVAYQSEEGKGGLQLKLRLKTSYKGMIVGVFVVYTDVSNAVFNDSPLVIEDTNYTLGMYGSWTFDGSGH